MKVPSHCIRVFVFACVCMSGRSDNDAQTVSRVTHTSDVVHRHNMVHLISELFRKHFSTVLMLDGADDIAWHVHYDVWTTVGAEVFHCLMNKKTG